nr:sorbitol dehydrogenase-like [Drosophila bipectinata]
MESALSCGICDLCKRGQYNMCSGMVYNGFMTTYQTHPGDLCHRLDPSISMDEGTLVQTLALGCQACLTGSVTPTSNVLIIGACPTAVSAGLCARAMGAKSVVIGGLSGKALEAVSRDFGFDTVTIDESRLFGEVLEAMYCKFHDWPDRVINCSISALTMNLAVMALQPSGICVLAECDSECASFNALDVLMKNIRLIPSFRSANMYPTALQLMKSGRAPMRQLIAGTFPMSHAEEAFCAALKESDEGLGKVIVNCADETGPEARKKPKSFQKS